jgi:hypothetical protein
MTRSGQGCRRLIKVVLVWPLLPPSSRFVRGSESRAHKKTLALYNLGQQEEAFVTFENSRNCR